MREQVKLNSGILQLVLIPDFSLALLEDNGWVVIPEIGGVLLEENMVINKAKQTLVQSIHVRDGELRLCDDGGHTSGKLALAKQKVSNSRPGIDVVYSSFFINRDIILNGIKNTQEQRTWMVFSSTTREADNYIGHGSLDNCNGNVDSLSLNTRQNDLRIYLAVTVLFNLDLLRD